MIEALKIAICPRQRVVKKLRRLANIHSDGPGFFAVNQAYRDRHQVSLPSCKESPCPLRVVTYQAMVKHVAMIVKGEAAVRSEDMVSGEARSGTEPDCAEASIGEPPEERMHEDVARAACEEHTFGQTPSLEGVLLDTRPQ